jgi:uncharacterized membrane protein YbhN (UPF0104 family)
MATSLPHPTPLAPPSRRRGGLCPQVGTDAAAAHAAPPADRVSAALDAFGTGGARAVFSPRRIALIALLLGTALAVALLGGPGHQFLDALARAASSQPQWVAAAVVAEALSFTGYVALLWLVGSRTTPVLDARTSYRLTLGGAAATRLLPTGGAGGIAFTLWVLRRTGLSASAATQVLLTFLSLLYAVFFAGLAVAGALVATGSLGSDGAPAALLAAVVGIGVLAFGLGAAAIRPLLPASPSRLTTVPAAVGDAVRGALGHLRRPDPRLLGGLVWWGLDAAVLWLLLEAFGGAPVLPVVALAYFAGTIANTLPIPGAVSGGLIGMLIALGVPAEQTILAVLTYRAIATWLPAPLGAAALLALRDQARGWERGDLRGAAPAVAGPDAPVDAGAPAGASQAAPPARLLPPLAAPARLLPPLAAPAGAAAAGPVIATAAPAGMLAGLPARASPARGSPGAGPRARRRRRG